MSTRLPAPARRRQLLDVAVTVFAGRGFHVTSMNDIADAAGVTKPVLYQHFPSKRHLYLEALTEVGNRLRQSIEKATTDAVSPREQVRSGMLAYLRFVAEDQDGFNLLFGGGTRRDEEFAQAARGVEDAIAASIASLINVGGVDRAGRELLAHAMVGMAEGASRHWLATDMEVASEQLANLVTQLAWAGLRGLSQG